ncbi:MAG: sigma factor-like helix-turn-helix DNA-binding protein, partial [Rubricoccaceae bacterium]|nr:sigma factor-like helix-turn-helix DNA-binding protein [Rubricoccaceae bacterium]
DSVAQAMSKLPDSIRDIAIQRLVKNRPYEEIAEETERPIATVRTYVAKAISRLREDEELCRFAADLIPGANIVVSDANEP